MRKLAVVLVILCAACMRPPRRQLIVVTTPDWNAVDGTMRLYEDRGHGWNKVGPDAPVVVGRTGMAWGKHEGDGKSPAGIFPLGTAFGFEPTAVKMPYLQLQATTECVDDVGSRFYNRIVDRTPSADWKSSEKMRSVGVYRHGVVIDYNPTAEPGRGSCIFLHIWSGPSHGTAGCTAMAEGNLDMLLGWLDQAAAPRVVQLPDAEYARLRAAWSLP